MADIKAVLPISGVYTVGGERMARIFGEDGKIADPLKLAPAVILSVPAD